MFPILAALKAEADKNQRNRKTVCNASNVDVPHPVTDPERMSKRPHPSPGGGGGGGSGPPSAKRVVFDPLQLGPIGNLEELEVKTLQFQNQRLGLRLNQRVQIEEELRTRIDQLEKRQTQDDAVINTINRYWNQLNEDIRILLERFDAETGDERENANEGEATKSFLAQLATWHKKELDEKLASRVHVSQRAVAKIIQVFDHLNQRNEQLSRLLTKELEREEADKNKDGKAAEGEGAAKADQAEGKSCSFMVKIRNFMTKTIISFYR